MSALRALVVANGEPPSPGFLREIAAGAALIVAADGGLAAALAAGLRVDAVVGDLDSAPTADLAAMPAGVVHRDGDPNSTDLQKAVAFAVASGAGEIDIVAAGGGRADHALGNLSILSVMHALARLRILDEQFAVSLCTGASPVTVSGPVGTLVSLVAIGRCAGVTTAGLRWELHDETLDFSPRGIHNEIAISPASVSVEDGELLVFEGRFVERHA